VLADEIDAGDPTDAEIAESTAVDPELEAAVGAVEAPRRRTRDNTKQATLIAMLCRPEGATIPQPCAVTGWQAHRVRGTFAGAFKKKPGLNLVSAKTKGADRV